MSESRFPATRGLQFREPPIFEISTPGRTAVSLPRTAADVAETEALALPPQLLRKQPPAWPEVSEPDAVRHYVRLSQHNYGIDTGFFPLGSCTMKYNPKVNEAVARMPGFAAIHPLAPSPWIQGALELCWELERLLAEISGFAAVTLQPAAGAHGEFTGLRIMRAHLLERDANPRAKILIPDTAHGTNPASCTLNGYKVLAIPSSDSGVLTAEAVAAVMDEDVAGIMITNPNTLGLFETEVLEIARIVHAKGGLLYLDGANLNSLMGRARPGEMGVDVMHFNLHKTFSTPHGGGGPGAGPVGVASDLVPYLPIPRIERVEVDGGEARFELTSDRPLSIGRVKAFIGNFGVLVRAYSYIRELGADGLKLATDMAVLNANYLRVRLSKTFHLPYDRTCMHEVVLTDRHQRKATGVETKDIAKGLTDRGFHPPTVYFPICVSHALMIEPTETESRETLDDFVAALEDIDRVARENPDALMSAPHVPLVGRLDETLAARRPVLRWRPPAADE